MVELLLALVALWVVSGLALLALCRCAARGDVAARRVMQRHRSAHWSRLDR